MWVVIPHVGKSHLTVRLLESIPTSNTPLVVDASWLGDLSAYSKIRGHIQYLRAPVHDCLAKNWNRGARAVPESEDAWMFCATDIEFSYEVWTNLPALMEKYPQAGIFRVGPNWGAFVMRRWCWDRIGPVDETYAPCGGEDAEILFRCWREKIPIRNQYLPMLHMEGGHAGRKDGRADRERNIAHFRENWGCDPSWNDPTFRRAVKETAC